MLLVDDDEPDVGERGEHAESRPDDDVDVAAPDPPPLIGALAFAEAAVEDRDARPEVGAQPVDERQSRGRSPGRGRAPGGRAASARAMAST